jgi:hypothetical protein
LLRLWTIPAARVKKRWLSAGGEAVVEPVIEVGAKGKRVRSLAVECGQDAPLSSHEPIVVRRAEVQHRDHRPDHRTGFGFAQC